MSIPNNRLEEESKGEGDLHERRCFEEQSDEIAFFVKCTLGEA